MQIFKMHNLYKVMSFIAFITFYFGVPCGDVLSADTKRTVYITIDDGPLSGFENIVDVLEQEKVNVTMFLVGMHVLASDSHKTDLERAIQNKYVLVGSHSYSHAHDHYIHFYSGSDTVLSDMRKNNRVLGLVNPPFRSRLPGRDAFRLPGISTDDLAMSIKEDKQERIDFDTIYKQGFYMYGWDLEWAREATGKPVQSVATILKSIEHAFDKGRTRFKDHLILLLHDQMFPDHLNGKENFRNLLKSLKAAGYNLATVDEYPGNNDCSPDKN